MKCKFNEILLMGSLPVIKKNQKHSLTFYNLDRSYTVFNVTIICYSGKIHKPMAIVKDKYMI